jgi:spore coat protein CotH
MHDNAGAAGAGAGAGGLATGSAGAGGAPAAPAIVLEPNDEATYLFDQTQLRTYNIVIAQADLDSINRHPSAEAWVQASLEFEGKTYGAVSVRYKGSAGAFMYPCTTGDFDGPKAGKCSLKLGFDEIDAKGHFFGLKKLNFHAMNADSSMLRDRLAYRLFRDAGVAAPRAAHARVLINGALEGLFVVVEQIDGRFTRGRFSEGGAGNLYKEVWPVYDDPLVYQAALETNAKDQPSVQGMLDLKSAIATGAASLDAMLDRDYFVRYIALDRLIVNDDGIFHFWCDPTAQGNNPGSFGNHNYYWYQASKEAHFWLIPWDLDNTFDNSPSVHIVTDWTATATASCECTKDPTYGIQRAASCDLLIQHFSTWRVDYKKKLDELVAGPFAKARVDALLNAWISQIQAAVSESSGRNLAPSESAWADAVMTLRANIESERKNCGYAY